METISDESRKDKSEEEIEAFIEQFLVPMIAESRGNTPNLEAMAAAAFAYRIDEHLRDKGAVVADRIKEAMRRAHTERHESQRPRDSVKSPEEVLLYGPERVPRSIARSLLKWMRMSMDVITRCMESFQEESDPHRGSQLEGRFREFLKESMCPKSSDDAPSRGVLPSSLSIGSIKSTATPPLIRNETKVESTAGGSGIPPHVAGSDAQAQRSDAKDIQKSARPPVDAHLSEGSWERISSYIGAVRASDAVVLEKADRTITEFQKSIADDSLRMAFVNGSLKDAPRFVIANGVGDHADIWFVGDLHGDLLALNGILEYVFERSDSENKDPYIIFLGDLFDDGNLGDFVVLRVMEEILKRSGHITLMAGNHDEALEYHEAEQCFRSTVTPSDFCDWLNEPAGPPRRRQLGIATRDLVRLAPRAILLEDGLLVAHGGVPHSDLQEKLKGDSNCLNDADCLQDFVWTRAHDTAKRRIPNRSTKGCSFGIEDFDGFCESASALLPHKIRRMVRGHDHVEERYKIHERYKKHPLLTINAMSYRQRDIFGPYVRVPCVARWIPDELPEVHRLHIPDDIVRRIYPESAVDSASK